MAVPKYTVTYLIADFDVSGRDRLRTGIAVVQIDVNTVVAAGRYVHQWGMIVHSHGGDTYVSPSAILSVKESGPVAKVTAEV